MHLYHQLDFFRYVISLAKYLPFGINLFFGAVRVHVVVLMMVMIVIIRVLHSWSLPFLYNLILLS